MKYEGFKLRGFIFQNKGKLERERFFLEGDSNAMYEFIIHDVGHNALDISTFCKYTDIAGLSNKVERDLHYLISFDAKLASTLASEANDKAYMIYNRRIDINIENVEYAFKIDGVGPKAIKMTCQVTYDEIATSDNPLESYLREIIDNSYSMDDEKLISEINRQWNEKVQKEKKLRQETLKDEEWKRRKQKELEEFLSL